MPKRPAWIYWKKRLPISDRVTTRLTKNIINSKFSSNSWLRSFHGQRKKRKILSLHVSTSLALTIQTLSPRILKCYSWPDSIKKVAIPATPWAMQAPRTVQEGQGPTTRQRTLVGAQAALSVRRLTTSSVRRAAPRISSSALCPICQ